MLNLLVGLADKTDTLEYDEPFCLIDDGPIADVFAERYPSAKLFNARSGGFNPLPMKYREARDFVAGIYGDKDLMTYRDGKRALMKMLLHTEANRLDRLPKIKHKGYEEAKETIDDILLSPTLRRMLCGRKSFSFKGTVIAKINRAELGDDDARIIGLLFIQQYKGQIILPDFGFYARPFHSALIREDRLIAGVQTLSQIKDEAIRDLCLLMPKEGRGVTYKDALALAEAKGLRQDPLKKDNPYNNYIDEVMAS